LRGKVSVAKVDCTVNDNIAKRFRIQGFPSTPLLLTSYPSFVYLSFIGLCCIVCAVLIAIKLLHHGRVYDYEGSRTEVGADHTTLLLLCRMSCLTCVHAYYHDHRVI
jgi:hypothetical protein